MRLTPVSPRWLLSSQWIEEAIAINSTTTLSNAPMAHFYSRLLKESGLTLQTQKVRENGVEFFNLIASSHDPHAKDLTVFHSHMDTVSEGLRSEWTKTGGNPFKATRIRDRIYGLGSADVKIDFLCKILAARNARPWQRPIALVSTYGEERGLVGAMKLFEDKVVTPKFALIGEPSNLELIYAHKGHLVFTLTVPFKKNLKGIKQKTWKGKSAHSSTPDLGENAIVKGFTEIIKRGVGIASIEGGTDSNRIPELCTAEITAVADDQTKHALRAFSWLEDFSREIRKRRDGRFKPAFSTLSINQVATRQNCLEFTCDIRGLPDLDLSMVLKKIQKAASQMNAEIENVVLNDPLKGRRNSPLMQSAASSLKGLGHKPVLATKASSTEAAVYSAAGCEAIVFGPGMSVNNVHKPNEHMTIGHLEIAVKLYTELMQQGIS